MKNIKKTLFVSLTSIISFCAIFGAIIAIQGGHLDFTRADNDAYGIEFNASKNKFHTNADGVTPISGSETVLTNHGNDVIFTYNAVIGSPSTWHILFIDGYFYNTTPILGMERISFAFNTDGVSFKIFWSGDSSFTNYSEQELTSSTSELVICNFNNETPNYFKVINTSESNLNISSMSLQLACTNNYFNLQVENDNEELGTFTGPTGHVLAGKNVSLVASPKEGCSLDGWYFEESKLSSDLIYSFEMPRENKYVTVKWINNGRYTLDTHGGTCSESFVVLEQDQAYELPTPTREGHQFDGWYLDGEYIPLTGTWSYVGDVRLLEAAWVGENLTFTLSNNAYTVKSGASISGDVVIPSIYHGLPVTTIANSAFSGRNKITSVVIPDSVTTINGSAFYNCTALESVTLSHSITAINGSTFYGCSSLNNIVIPEGVTKIEGGAFQNCTSLTDISIPDSVTRIDGYSFAGCSSLTSFYFSKYVNDFNTQIRSSIGSYFAGCTSLTELTVDPENPNYKTINGCLYSKYDGLLCCPGGISGDYVVSSGTTFIEAYAFGRCDLITSVTIPASVTSIGDHAFYRMNGAVEFVVDPENSKYLTNDGVLFNKAQTELITYPGGKESDYIVPNTVETINKESFFGSKTIRSIVVSSSVTKIGYNAFRECSNLYSATLNEGLETMEHGVFYQCSSLIDITIPSSVSKIDQYTFYFCTSLESITFYDGLSEIGTNSFYGCSKLSYIDVPGSVKTIKSYAFGICSKMNYAVLNNGVQTIENNAFYLSSIFAISIYNTVTTIGKSAFSHCSFLRDVFYQGTEEDWAQISISADNAPLTSDSTIHYEDAFMSMTKVEDDSKSYFLSDYNLVFNLIVKDKTITSFDFAEELPGTTIISIGKEAFQRCSSLTSLVLPNTISTIGNYAFAGSGITSITVPHGVKRIEDSTFEGCVSLTDITLPNSIVYIGWSAIFNDNNLTTIHFIGSEEQWNQISVASNVKTYIESQGITVTFAE